MSMFQKESQENDERNNPFSTCSFELALSSRKTSAVLSSKGSTKAVSFSWEELSFKSENFDVTRNGATKDWLLRKIISALKVSEKKSPKVLILQRSTILDWVIGVLATRSQSPSTFFRTVSAIDNFHSSEEPSLRDAYLTACAALSLMSKFDNSRYILLKTLEKAASSHILSKDEILNRQFELIERLGIKCDMYTLIDVIEEVVETLSVSQQEKTLISRAALLVLRMCVFSTELWFDVDHIEMLGYCMVFSIKILGSLRPTLDLNDAIEKVTSIFDLENSRLKEKLRSIHFFVVNFESCFPEAKNLRRYHKFSLFN